MSSIDARAINLSTSALSFFNSTWHMSTVSSNWWALGRSVGVLKSSSNAAIKHTLSALAEKRELAIVRVLALASSPVTRLKKLLPDRSRNTLSTSARSDYRLPSTGFFYRRNKEGCPKCVVTGAPNVSFAAANLSYSVLERPKCVVDYLPLSQVLVNRAGGSRKFFSPALSENRHFRLVS